MIKANELRIGNMVQDEIGLEKELIVYKIEEGVITCGDRRFWHPYLIEDLKPIPLTPEVLIKLGFTYDDPEPEKGCMYKKNRVSLWVRGNGEIIYGRNNLHVQYIHELQNIYYFNTGEELEINL